jgi:oligopeptide/dipeptide ABC transporter ATP-binding protein
MPTGTVPLLEAQDLVKMFDLPRRQLLGERPRLQAVGGVNLTLRSEETLGLVGESGCGKTTLGRLIVKLETPTSGRVLIRGRDIHERNGSRHDSLTRSVQMIFQDPLSSLNPRKRIRDAIREPLLINRITAPSETDSRVAELMAEVGLPLALMDRYPSQLSGGQQQRVAIARALSVESEVLVADEPLSALDVSVQAQVLRLLQSIRSRRRLSILFISHDLAVVRRLCDRVAVMYLGRIVEEAPARELFRRPRHPYTVALLSAVPRVGRSGRLQIRVTGEPGSAANIPPGCPFHPRCFKAQDRCKVEPPPLVPLDAGMVACHFPE